jgi:hypothetical protein
MGYKNECCESKGITQKSEDILFLYYLQGFKGYVVYRLRC